MDTSSKRFTVMLIEPKDRGTGKGSKLYEGDSFDDAERAANQAAHKPENAGKFIRFYDFTFFGGGMKDIKIKG